MYFNVTVLLATQQKGHRVACFMSLEGLKVYYHLRGQCNWFRPDKIGSSYEELLSDLLFQLKSLACSLWV